jgi:hypothetical protein
MTPNQTSCFVLTQGAVASIGVFIHVAGVDAHVKTGWQRCRKFAFLIAGCCAYLPIAVAHAQNNDIISRDLVLAKDQIESSATVEVSLDSLRVGKPWSVAPDFRVGIGRNIDVGVTSSHQSSSTIGAGAGICTRAKMSGCDGSYRDVALDARVLALSHVSEKRTIQLAPRFRLLFREFDPLKPALVLGTGFSVASGRFAISSDPNLQLGLLNRDLGNRARMFVPLRFTLQPTCRWAISAFTAFESELAVIKDGWHGLLGASVLARVTETVDISASAGFPSLYGPQNTTKRRALSVTATLHAW